MRLRVGGFDSKCLRAQLAHRILSCSQRNMRKSEKAPRRRKRQPPNPKSGSQNREKSTRGDGNCVGNLISALPRLRGLAAAHAAVVEQHAEVQMVQEASQHVQEARRRRKDRHVGCSTREQLPSGTAPSFRHCCRPLPAHSPLPAAGDIAPGPGQQLHTPPDARRVQHLAAKPPAVQKDQVTGLAGAKFELQSESQAAPAAVVLSSWIGHTQLERP